ncbi:MAG: Fic family protein [Lewinellaceae bacterium]|nr:Fic family protein [Lewinellaceae bacterium]
MNRKPETAALKALLSRIDALKAEMDSEGPLSDEARRRLNNKVRLELNYHSNRIEGNSLDYGETKLLLLKDLTANGKPLKDHLEIKGHNEALKKLEAIAGKELAITENLIKEFHNILLIDPFKDYPELLPGVYKDRPNYLYNYRGERVDFLPPDEVPNALNELINWTNNALNLPKARKKKYRRELYDIHPVLVAAEFHLRFVNIHPFIDGNGRMARIFMNLILMQCGFPPVVIRNETRDEYYRAIETSRQRGTEEFFIFIGQRVVEALEFYLSVAQGGPVEEPDDWEKRIELLQRSLEEEEAPTVEKTNELLWQRFQDSFLPLFELLEQKLRRFDGFYAKHQHGPKYATQEAITGKEKEEPFEAFIRRTYEQEKLPVFQELGYRFHWEGLKNSGTQLFELAFSVRINLEHRFKYSVSVAFPEIPDMEKLYSQTISEEERRNLVRQVGDKLVEIVENQVKKAKDEE